MSFLKRELKTIVIVVATAALTAGTPAIAHGVHAAFAHNADKVDNKHAVGAGATLTQARGRLVATGTNGKFAGRFIPKVAAAVNADELGGLTSADYAKDLGNVVTVALSGGDFTSIQAAIDSISGATQQNPWVVLVGAGLFQGRVVLKNGVSIEGVGNATRIFAPGNSEIDEADTATLVGGTGSTVRNVSIESSGPNRVIGVYNDSGGFTLDSVTVAVDSPTGAPGYAVVIQTGITTIRDSVISSFSFAETQSAIGIAMSGGALELWNSKVVAESTLPGTGLAVVNGASNNISIRGSQISTTGTGIFNADTNDAVRVAYSEIPSVGGAGDLVCHAAFGPSFEALDTTCEPPAP